MACSSEHGVCRPIGSPGGGTLAETPNLQAPGNLIPSSSTDTTLLVTQKGYSSPCARTGVIYTTNCTPLLVLYILVPPPTVTAGHQIQNSAIYEVTMVLSGSLRFTSYDFSGRGALIDQSCVRLSLWPPVDL